MHGGYPTGHHELCGIDLHSNNSVVSVIDETDRVVAEKRLPNDLAKILAFLAPWRAELAGVVVESTYYGRPGIMHGLSLKTTECAAACRCESKYGPCRARI
ncbi:hypothetical protein BSU04_04975 [Caballeronia sordidicola]|uniref:Mobile element protein n=1 Tax=Caballeronia sordidicola TaxID=196367 RepID=A0A226X8P4_CABSO|nr:hypothetical protein BSU04_04975 [Caballeronia sordidicola]